MHLWPFNICRFPDLALAGFGKAERPQVPFVAPARVKQEESSEGYGPPDLPPRAYYHF